MRHAYDPSTPRVRSPHRTDAIMDRIHGVTDPVHTIALSYASQAGSWTFVAGSYARENRAHSYHARVLRLTLPIVRTALEECGEGGLPARLRRGILPGGDGDGL